MSKEFKKILDEAELSFNFLNKNQLKILRIYLEMAWNQGVVDFLNNESNKN